MFVCPPSPPEIALVTFLESRRRQPGERYRRPGTIRKAYSYMAPVGFGQVQTYEMRLGRAQAGSDSSVGGRGFLAWDDA